MVVIWQQQNGGDSRAKMVKEDLKIYLGRWEESGGEEGSESEIAVGFRPSTSTRFVRVSSAVKVWPSD